MKSKSFFRASSFGKKRNFMSSSKAKANEGFRMLMNWSANSLTLRSIVGAAVAFCLIVLVLVYDQSRSTQNSGELSVESCNCFEGVQNTTNYSPAALQANTAILYLPKPQRPFHGNHWFHIGEYYISRRKLIQDMLAQQQLHDPVQHLKIIAQDPKLANMMTKMSFSLIAMSCLSAVGDHQLGALQTIELYREPDVQLSVSPSTAQLTVIDSFASAQRVKLTTSQQPLFGYYAQNSADEMIIEYRTSTSGASDKADVTRAAVTSTSQAGQASTPTKCLKKSFSSLEDIYRWSTEPLFAKSTHTAGCVSEQCMCGVFIGAVGHAPIPSHDWFHSTGDADSLRSTALSMCSISQLQQTRTATPPHTASTVNTGTGHHKLTLLIYQRDLNRRFVHLDAIKEALIGRNSISRAPNNMKYEWDVRVIMHNEDAAPCDTIRTLHSADILLTAHGFQSTGNYDWCAIDIIDSM